MRSNYSDHETGRRIAFISITAVILVAVIYAILLFIAKFDIFPMPQGLKDIILFFERNEEESQELDKIYEILRDPEKYEGKYEFSSLSLSNISSLLNQLREPDVFYRKSKVTYYYGEESISYTHQVYKDGDRVRIDTASEDISKTVIHSDGDTLIRYPETGDEVLYENNSTFSYLEETGILGIVSFTSMEGSGLSTFLNITRGPSGSTISFRFNTKTPDGEPLYTEEYEVSLNNGLVLSAKVFSGGEPVYTLSTTEFEVGLNIPDELFTINKTK